MEELITIGKITKNQGNKGEVRVIPLTGFPERFKVLEKVFLVKNNNILEKVIEDVWFHKEFVILKFEGIENIGDTFTVRNYFVKIKEADLLPLKENEFYIYQILDFDVYTGNQFYLGKLVEVLPTGGTDVFIVKGDKKDYMIPASHEVIKEIDKKQQKIIINPLPGLLEL